MMSTTVEQPLTSLADRGSGDARGRWTRFIGPTVVATVVAALVLGLIVASSRTAWTLLGAGHGVVPEDYYPIWAFVIVFVTMMGQAVGWAGGSGIAYVVLTRAGMAPGPRAWKLAISLVYIGLGALPLLIFHVAFGRPLLGLPREGLAARVAAEYPDAYRLVFAWHPLIDASVVPLAALFFGFVWLASPERSAAGRYGVALALVGTSLAIALSIAIHSILVHLRF
jgi:hypothetical protein